MTNVTINFKGKAISVDGVPVTVGVGRVLEVDRFRETSVAVLLITAFMELLDLLHGELLDNLLDALVNESPTAFLHGVRDSGGNLLFSVDRDDFLDGF